MAERVAITGLAARSAGFTTVTRFDTGGRRTGVAATLPGTPVLADELVAVIREACAGADAHCPLLLAAHADRSNAAVARDVAERVGARYVRTYTAACVAGSSAVADAAALVASGRCDRVVVAAGFVVDAGIFGTFDAGRALARDGRLRPFSAGRQGMVLGDAFAAVVLEAGARHGRATLAGWGRSGDAYHVCQPKPDGTGLARAITAALKRAGVAPAEIGYVNANGTGTVLNDSAEAAALHHALGPDVARIPVSSTKSTHGHALEATGLLELVLTVRALETRTLPVNAGFLGPDECCRLDLVLEPRATDARYALSVNAAFGGANTALLVGAP
ncbi:MAG TPA: beta-ketoacyl synthase N-terminal-like domain-containing protein [Pseudonocardiaceae bacterium]|jgi:3-oxoacyl-[acyl-carrier-protein] synthase II|nr:beta-ketoacyl synthase N-terminal-like domain-containing protein [Pseudonocardiaceae bacterium]